MPSPQGANLFAPPSEGELQSAKASLAAGPKKPMQDIFAPPSAQEIEGARMNTAGLIKRQNVQGEAGFIDRAALSFASNDEEKGAYLQKKYPGTEVRQMDTGKKGSDGRPETITVFKRPEDSTYRYIDDPTLSLADIADFAGDIPGAVTGAIGAGLTAPSGPGAVAGAAGGAAIGEGLRKAAGYGLVGIPRRQGAGEAATDVLLAGAGGAAFPIAAAGAKKIFGAGAKAAADAVGKVTGKGLLNEATDTAAAGAVKGAAAPEAAAASSGLIREGADAVNTADDLAGYLASQNKRMSVPETFEQLGAAYRADQAAGKTTSLPSKMELQKAIDVLGDLETPPTRLHLDMLDSQAAKDIVQMRKALPSEEAEALNYYEQKMKGELVDKFKSALSPLVKRDPLAPADAGEALMEATRTRHRAVQQNLAPEFQKLRDVPADPAASLPALQQRIMRSIPSLQGKIQLTEGPGGVKAALAPYKPSMGISKETYGLVNEVLDDVSTPKTFKEMQNIRETIRKALDPVNPKATRELEGLRSAILEHMEETAAAQNPNVNVRELFKAYAQNENRYELAQKLMKGSLDSRDPTKRPSPEKILNSIFLNQKSVAAAKEAFGEQEVAGMAHDLLNEMVAKNTKQGNVSSIQLQKFLRDKGVVLEEALKGSDPKTAQAIMGRLRALVDVMRIVPDAPPINPSGTAKTRGLMQALGKGAKSVATLDTGGLLGALREGAEAVGEARAGSAAVETLDQVLKGKPKTTRSERAIKTGLGLLDRGSVRVGGAQLGAGLLRDRASE